MKEPNTLGDYTIIKQIGQGPLGSVLLAEHKFMKRQYCLKVLPMELSQDRAFIQRFEEEIGRLVYLSHPNIVKVHNISYASGRYFVVTDCIVDEMGETTNLAQYMLSLEKHLSDSELFDLLEQVADALDYAHAQIVLGKPLLHRELKLNNILVSKTESGPKLLLTDFGLSKIIGEGPILTRTYKSVAEALGIYEEINPLPGSERIYSSKALDESELKPLHASFLQNFFFLAPEQRSLSGKEIGVKADVYAFGVLAYFLITAKFPEGYFELPSESAPHLSWNWDNLIIKSLMQNEEKRAEELLPLLRAVKDSKREVSPSRYFLNTEEAPAPVLQEALHTSQKVVSVHGNIPDTWRPHLNEGFIERPMHDPDPAAQFIIDQSVKHYEPKKKEARLSEPLLTDMAIIKGCSYTRGSNDGSRDEMPRHQVHIDSFALDVHPVTNEQFVRFLEALGGEKDSNHNDVIRLKDSRIKRSAGKLIIESGYAKHPVVGVTWYGAVAYAKWLGKRLPTEAEWELAAKGEDENLVYPCGDEMDKSKANFFSSDTTPVMSYPPSYYGLYDMAGNVYEWCHDWYGYNYYEVSAQEPDNPKGPLQGVYRVLRGGCWKSLKEDLRCSKRHRNNPGTVNGTYGFRCAADVEE
jgi:formylglycine-generating enzyme required for sulfatase activity